MSSEYIIKNCPCYESEGAFYNCVNERIEGDCQDCTSCVMKKIVEKLKEVDNSCYGIDCAECSGFYMCRSKFANDVLKLFDIEEIE